MTDPYVYLAKVYEEALEAERALADLLADALIHCAPAKFAMRDEALAAWEEARRG